MKENGLLKQFSAFTLNRGHDVLEDGKANVFELLSVFKTLILFLSAAVFDLYIMNHIFTGVMSDVGGKQ